MLWLAIRLYPEFAQAHANLGIALRQDGRLAESISWFRRPRTELAPEVRPSGDTSRTQPTDLDRYSEAIECYKNLIELESSRPLDHSNLGWLLMREGKYDDAREKLRDGAANATRIPGGHDRNGRSHGGAGVIWSEAESWFRRTIARHPADTIASTRLARLCEISSPRAISASCRGGSPIRLYRKPPAGHLLFALSNVLDARGEYRRGRPEHAPGQRDGTGRESAKVPTLPTRRPRASDQRHDRGIPA